VLVISGVAANNNYTHIHTVHKLYNVLLYINYTPMKTVNIPDSLAAMHSVLVEPSGITFHSMSVYLLEWRVL